MEIINFKQKKAVFSEFENNFCIFDVSGSVIFYDKCLDVKNAKDDVENAVSHALSFEFSNSLELSLMIDSILRNHGYESETFVSSVSNRIKTEKQAKKLGLVSCFDDDFNNQK